MRFRVLVGVALATLLIPASALATTVRQTSVGEMLGACELIFEGVATARGSEESDDGHIFTWVDFAVLDVLKGPAVGPRIRLHFLGGVFEDRVVQVGGMRVPKVGERGLYFVESLQRRQAHPLFGWDQGRLRIVPDSGGIPRIVSADGTPVVGLGRSGVVTEPTVELSDGVAAEIELDVGAPLEDALSASDLKAQLRRRLAGGS